ncbi:MAG: SHOCT domain-containing protein [Anaerolineales bacterium]|nr:SHOCT domain-containing protein [Anaerolineales bacterium]MCK5428274.1 SHOCT domain-containing protein [Anaerolineales bacterium]
MRGARRAGRRTARRTTHRTMRRRRRRRRRILVGGMVLLAVGGAAYGAVKLSQNDAQRIEEKTGQSVEDLSDEELTSAMSELGIESQELSDEDRAALDADSASAGETEAEPSYLDELEKLAGLRDQGIITEGEYEAKKKQLLGL